VLAHPEAGLNTTLVCAMSATDQKLGESEKNNADEIRFRGEMSASRKSSLPS
jgi:hypothetical protein